MCDAMADAHAVTRAPRDPESETDEVTRGWSRAPTPCAVLASVDPISDLASGGDARVVPGSVSRSSRSLGCATEYTDYSDEIAMEIHCAMEIPQTWHWGHRSAETGLPAV